jgi:hypothetical protein
VLLQDSTGLALGAAPGAAYLEATVSVQTTYPGVYVREQKSGNATITGVSTSVTAFVGAARKGPGDAPVRLSSYASYLRQFGDPISTAQPMGHAVGHFFANGGSQAIIVRALGAGAAAATRALPAVNGMTVAVTARSRGAWANGAGASTPGQTGVFVEVVPAVDFPADRFGLVITEWAPGTGGGPATVTTRETWAELTMSPRSTRYVGTVLNASTLVTATVSGTPCSRPRRGDLHRRPLAGERLRERQGPAPVGRPGTGERLRPVPRGVAAPVAHDARGP